MEEEYVAIRPWRRGMYQLDHGGGVCSNQTVEEYVAIRPRGGVCSNQTVEEEYVVIRPWKRSM